MKVKGWTVAWVLVAVVMALVLATAGHAAARSARTASSVLELTGVTCKGTSFCVATGYYATDARKPEHPPILDMWNGRSWRAIPQPRRGILNMNDIQCPGPSFCLALRTLLGPPISTDVVTWNGRSWKTINLQAPVPLQNVTCLSARFCVGWGSTDSGRVVTWWNGKDWQGMPSSTDGCGGPDCQYRGLTCASETNCMLRGLYCGDETCEDEFNYVQAGTGDTTGTTPRPTSPPPARASAAAAPASHRPGRPAPPPGSA